MKKYDILSDADRILRSKTSKPRKPGWISRDRWNELGEEVKNLWNEIEYLGDAIYEAYLEAVRHEDWKRALEMVLLGFGKPILCDADKAKEWVAEAEGLLNPGT